MLKHLTKLISKHKLLEPIFNALHNDKNMRTKDGQAFAQNIEKSNFG